MPHLYIIQMTHYVNNVLKLCLNVNNVLYQPEIMINFLNLKLVTMSHNI